jgi:hypothetical protein
MEELQCSPTSQGVYRQELFWQFVQEQVSYLVSELLDTIMDGRLKVGWRQ